MLPPEAWTLILSTAASWFMKYKAQQAANIQAERLENIRSRKRLQAEQNAAAKRSSPFLRKFVAMTVIIVCFGGIFVVAFFPEIPVTEFKDVPQKSILWGLLKWGETTKIIQATGLVFPEWVKFSVITIIGFLFGGGLAKTSG